jgi:hypothetical protein
VEVLSCASRGALRKLDVLPPACERIVGIWDAVGMLS